MSKFTQTWKPALTGRQIEALSQLYMWLDKDDIKEEFGVQRANVIRDAIANIEKPLFNSGKPMHERGRLATDKYTLPLEAPS